MKRLGRWLFNLGAGVSLLVCVATGVLWVRSYFALDMLTWGHTDSATRLYSSSGVIGIVRMGFIDTEPGLIRYQVESPEDDLRSARGVLDIWELAAFAFGRPFPAGLEAYLIQVPFWFLVILTAVPPALWLRVLLRQRTIRRQGLCLFCGYDLRATPDRCPECGAVPKAAKGAAG